MKREFTDGENVVMMKEFQAAMSFPLIKEVEAYWDGLRNGRPVPKRSEIDPRGIERALENAFIIERIAPGMARFRLAGMHLNDMMGMETRGMPFTSFFTAEGRKDASKVLEAVFDNPAIAEISVTAETGIGKPELHGRLIILPLKSDLGDVSRALGVFATEGEIGRAPRRFTITERNMRRILGDTPVTAPTEPQLPEVEKTEDKPDLSHKIPGFEETKAMFKGAKPAKTPGQTTLEKKTPHLRLVKTDKD